MRNRFFLGHNFGKEMIGTILGRKRNLRHNDWEKKICHINHRFFGLAQDARLLNLQPGSFICKFFPLQAGHSSGSTLAVCYEPDLSLYHRA